MLTCLGTDYKNPVVILDSQNDIPACRNASQQLMTVCGQELLEDFSSKSALSRHVAALVSGLGSKYIKAAEYLHLVCVVSDICLSHQ